MLALYSRLGLWRRKSDSKRELYIGGKSTEKKEKERRCTYGVVSISRYLPHMVISTSLLRRQGCPGLNVHVSMYVWLAPKDFS